MGHDAPNRLGVMMAKQPKAKGRRNQIQEWTAIPAPYLKRCGVHDRSANKASTKTSQSDHACY
jgi:hypothetical protein